MIKDLRIDEFLNDTDLRTLLGVSRTTLWRLRKYEGLPFGKVGREFRYRKSQIVEWVQSNQFKHPQLKLNFDTKGRPRKQIK